MLNGFAIRHPAPLVDRSNAPSIPWRLPLSMLGHGPHITVRRGMARPRPFRCLSQFRNSFLLSLGGEECTYATKHGTTAGLKRNTTVLLDQHRLCELLIIKINRVGVLGNPSSFASGLTAADEFLG